MVQPHAMSDEYEDKVRALSTEKALSVAAYGESVAAYRYRALSEKSPSENYRETFVEMAEEEQEHHVMVQELLKRHFPGSDFVLAVEDKELVIAGPRTLDVGDPEAFARSLGLICESERLTGRFYAVLHAHTTHENLRPLLKEMAEECVEHAKRLEALGSGN